MRFISSTKDEIRYIVFKRVLKSGYSVSGEIVDNESINNLLVSIANLLDLKGSINIQLRIVNDIPYIFEINPRFSSTVRFRDLFGFRDVLWVLQDNLNQKYLIIINLPQVLSFLKVIKNIFYEEFF